MRRADSRKPATASGQLNSTRSCPPRSSNATTSCAGDTRPCYPRIRARLLSIFPAVQAHTVSITPSDSRLARATHTDSAGHAPTGLDARAVCHGHGSGYALLPSATVTTATIANPGLRRRERRAKRTSSTVRGILTDPARGRLLLDLITGQGFTHQDPSWGDEPLAQVAGVRRPVRAGL